MEEENSPRQKFKSNLPPLNLDDDESIEEEDIVTKFSLRTPDVNMFLKTPCDNIKDRFWKNKALTPHAPSSCSSYTTPRRTSRSAKFHTPLTSPHHGKINTAPLLTPRHKELEMNESQEIIRRALLLDTPNYIKRTSSNLHFVDPTLEEIRNSFKSFPLVANDLDICGQIVKEAQPNVTDTVKENPLYSNLLTIFEDTLRTQIANTTVNDLEHEILELFHLHRPLLRKITSVNPELGLFQNTLFGSTIQLLDKLNSKYVTLEKDYNKLLEEKIQKEKLSEDVKARVKAEIEADSLRQHAAQLEVELAAYKKLFHEKAKALDAYKRTKGYNAMSWTVEKADTFFKKVDEMEDLMVVIESTVHKRVGIMDDMKQLINNLADVEAENIMTASLPKEE